MIYGQYDNGNVNGEEIAANESYVGAEGCFRAIEESYENEHTIFNALIAGDFAEAYNKVNESMVSESQLQAIQEGALGNIWKKVVEFVNKVIAKIKGIIDSLITRIKSTFIRDGKVLVTKYGKVVTKKINKGELDKMKFKFFKDASYELPGNAIGSLTLYAKADADLAKAKEFSESKINSATDPDKLKAIRLQKDVGGVDGFAPYTTDEKTDKEEAAFGELLKGSACTASEFTKTVADDFEDSLDEVEGYTAAINTTIEAILTSNAKAITALEKEKKAVETALKKIQKDAEDLAKKADKASGQTTPAYNGNQARAGGTASRVVSIVTILNKVTTTYYTAASSVLKKSFSSARSAYVKAVNYKAKKSELEESAVLLQGLMETSDYEVDMMVEGTFVESLLY